MFDGVQKPITILHQICLHILILRYYLDRNHKNGVTEDSSLLQVQQPPNWQPQNKAKQYKSHRKQGDN